MTTSLAPEVSRAVRLRAQPDMGYGHHFIVNAAGTEGTCKNCNFTRTFTAIAYDD